MDDGQARNCFAAISQETRLAIVRLLVKAGPEGLSAGVIGQKLGLAAPTLSFHLKELSHAGLVDSRQEGRFVIYSTDFKTMNGLIAYLTENCCQGVTVTCCPPVSAGAANMARVARKAQ